MPEVVGVRFLPAGKLYHYETSGLPLKTDDLVVIRGEHGTEVGRVVENPTQLTVNETGEQIKKVLRKPRLEDLEQLESARKKEAEAVETTKKNITELNLKMKLVSIHSNLESNHITVYFTAEERVDFRELVRRLSHSFKARVEMKQIGPRDEAKIIGGMGRCGWPLCCRTFLDEFSPVSIRMAKDQELSLNPMKISGNCGRLLCCLGYEEELYQQAKEKLPKLGQEITSHLGKAKVVGTNILKETVLVELQTKVIVELPLAQAEWEGKGQKKEVRQKQKQSINPKSKKLEEVCLALPAPTAEKPDTNPHP